MGDGSATTLSDFAGYQFGGTWADNGQSKAVSGGVYLLRLNADCLEDQIGQALPATITIDEKTKTTL